MSYEGRTSYAPRSFFRHAGQTYNGPSATSTQQNYRFKYVASTLPNQEIKNPFNSMTIKLSPEVAATYPDYVSNNGYRFGFRGIGTTDADHLGGFALYSSNKVIQEMWGPHTCLGVVNLRYFTKNTFINSTSITQNKYLSMEW